MNLFFPAPSAYFGMADFSSPIWLTGPTHSGKTRHLIDRFWQLVQTGFPDLEDFRRTSTSANPRLVVKPSQRARMQRTAAAILVFADTGDNRLTLTDRITTATQGQCPVSSKTPLSFFEDEVLLFWPLLIQKLQIKAQFPIRLRPENEQELATQLWRLDLDRAFLQAAGVGEYRLVRRMLDCFQLAAFSNIPIADIPTLLEQGFPEQSALYARWGDYLQQWRSWCLERGLLTYGLVTELYGQYLLPDPVYQQQLRQRYRAVFADDLDNYPALMQDLFAWFLDQGAIGLFTDNPEGSSRLGLGADPDAFADLRSRCQVTPLAPSPSYLGNTISTLVVDLVTNPIFLAQLPDPIQVIATTTRSQLLRRTADLIIAGVQSGEVQPQEIAVITPGLDAIARYSLSEILAAQGIAVEPLNEQRPLVSSAMVQALLTLLALVYPHLGRLVDRDAITEMLVVLSQKPREVQPTPDGSSSASPHPTPVLLPSIDFVRASLIADHCFEPHPDHPRLLPIAVFPRWDRLGYQAATTYDEILQWIEQQKQQQEQRLLPSPIALLDRAIQRFLWNGNYLAYDRLAALRALIETAQHYWTIDSRLQQSDAMETATHHSVGRFIQLLRNGTITADPYPVRSVGISRPAVMLANIFQYRSNSLGHRWQFWLDASSPRWLTGTEALYGSQLFLRGWSGRPWTEADTLATQEARLQRVLVDLLHRAREKVFLCHSDLAVNGQEQMGALFALVNAAAPVEVLASVH